MTDTKPLSARKYEERYADVPHKGERFKEGGFTYYWTYGSERVGARYKGAHTAWRPTGMPQMMAGTGTTRDIGGKQPVQLFEMHSPGHYYKVPYDLTVVEESRTRFGRIVKWRINEESDECNWIHSFKRFDLQ